MSDTRLFVQLQVFTECLDVAPVVDAVRRSGLVTAVYANLNDPRGIGVVAMDEDPTMFADSFRALLVAAPFSQLTPLPDFTMIGRTYAQGREPDLADFCSTRCRATSSTRTTRGRSGIPSGGPVPTIGCPAQTRARS